MIGIKKIPLQKIKNEKGNILKFLSKKNSFFKKFGEIYFSEINYKKTKGWNYHSKCKCHLSVISGKVSFHFLKKKNNKFLSKKIILSKNNYSMIIVSPKIFISFKGLKKNNTVVNFLEIPHNPYESKKFKTVNKIQIKD